MFLQFLPLFFFEFEAAFSAEGAEKGERFGGFGGGEDGDFDINATGAFEIDLNEIGTAGSKDPDKLATVTRVGHFLGDHGIDAARDAGVTRAAGAFSEGLVGFVDEDHAAVEGV